MYVLATILIIALVLILSWAVIRFFPKKTVAGNDPRSHLEPNDTNYNIANQITPEIIENASEEEAEEIIEKYQRGELPSLSDEDFYRLMRRVRKDRKV